MATRRGRATALGTVALAHALAGCSGAASTTSPMRVPAVTAAPVDAPPPPPPPVLVHRKLTANSASATASRTTFTLAIDGARAELIEVDETVPDVHSIAEADAAPAWRRVAVRSYRGTARSDGSAQVLELATPDQQPLAMRCVPVTVTVAAPGAHRVASGRRGSVGCDPGTWDPPATHALAALACGEGSTDAPPDTDDDDRLVFGDPIGVEYVFENDGCTLRGGGLRELGH